MAPNAQYYVLALVAGVGIPIMAALNASIGARLASPATASVVLFLVALTIAAGAVAVTGSPSWRSVLIAAPPGYYLAGGFVAFYVLTITYAAPRIGVGNAVFLVLVGQIASAALIDHFGLFGAPRTPVSIQRLAGILIMATGVYLARRPPAEALP